MRYPIPFAIACLLIGAGTLPAQQRGSLGPPDTSPAGVSAPAAPLPASVSSTQAAPALGPPPAPTQAAPALGPPPTPSPAPAQAAPVLGPPPTPSTAPPPPAPYMMPGGYAVPPGDYAPPPVFPPPVVLADPRNPSIWLGAEALLWWTKNQPLSVPLITTGPASQGANAGNLGVPGTTSLNGPFNNGMTGGARLFAGSWLESSHTIGIDGSLFFLGQQSSGFGAADRSGTGGVVINEPVVSAPWSTQVSAPGFDTGGVAVNATSRLAGGDINLLYNLYRAGGWTINLQGGYRYLELDESLDITANSLMFVTTTYTDNMGNVLVTAPPGSTVTVLDHFGTRNEFNGGQVGVTFQYVSDRWVLEGGVKVAIGATHEVVTVDGATNVFPVNGSPVPLIGGNYATLQIGRYARNPFAVAPEAQLSVGYQFTPWLRGMIGYNFLYLSTVARPGNQIDNSYDGVVHPLVPITGSSYWTQGINLGLQFRF